MLKLNAYNSQTLTCHVIIPSKLSKKLDEFNDFLEADCIDSITKSYNNSYTIAQSKQKNTFFSSEQVNCLGLKFNLMHVQQSYINGYFDLTYSSGNNDLIGAIPNCKIVKRAILLAIECYKAADATLLSPTQFLNYMDLKRFPHGLQWDKKELTLRMSGPTILLESMHNEWDVLRSKIISSDFSFDDKNTILKTIADDLLLKKTYPFHTSSIANMQVTPKCDNTWLQKQPEHSYTTDSITTIKLN